VSTSCILWHSGSRLVCSALTHLAAGYIPLFTLFAFGCCNHLNHVPNVLNNCVPYSWPKNVLILFLLCSLSGEVINRQNCIRMTGYTLWCLLYWIMICLQLHDLNNWIHLLTTYLLKLPVGHLAETINVGNLPDVSIWASKWSRFISKPNLKPNSKPLGCPNMQLYLSECRSRWEWTVLFVRITSAIF
jgi:hypothetical protein